MPKVIKPKDLRPSEKIVHIPDVPDTVADPLLELSEQGEDGFVGEDPLAAGTQLQEVMTRAAEAKANDVSQKILQNARTERERILKQAQDEAQQLREETKRLQDEAQRSAYEEVLEKKHQEIDECIRGVDALMEELQRQQQSFLQQYEEGLFAVSLDIVRKVLGASIPQHEELMIPLVREAVSTVKNASWISVQVSSRLPGLIEALKRELAAWQAVQQLEVSGADLPEDGCVVHTSYGVVDASVSEQLKNLEAIFNQSKE